MKKIALVLAAVISLTALSPGVADARTSVKQPAGIAKHR